MKKLFLIFNLLFIILSFNNIVLATTKNNKHEIFIKTNNIITQTKSLNSIILIVPTTGFWSNFGIHASQGAKLSLSQDFNLITIDENENNVLPKKTSLDKTAIVIGHLFESSLANNTNAYLFKNKVVILPFISEDKISHIENNYFFSLMPSHKLQGEFLAISFLNRNKRERPDKILIIRDNLKDNEIFVKNFLETLKNPPRQTKTTDNKKKNKKVEIKGLADGEIIIIEKTLTDVKNLNVEEFAADIPKAIIIAVSKQKAIELAPWLKKQNFVSSEIKMPSSLASRHVGATFLKFGLNTEFILPINLNTNDKNIEAFKTKYLNTYKQEATWVSALAYDAVSISIKAISIHNNTLNDENHIDIIAYLFYENETHKDLGEYKIIKPLVTEEASEPKEKNKTKDKDKIENEVPAEAEIKEDVKALNKIQAPVTFMKLTDKTLAYLP